MTKQVTRYWIATYSDGHTQDFVNPQKPAGNAARYLNSEKRKGRDHGILASIREVSKESLIKQVEKKISLPTPIVEEEINETTVIVEKIIDEKKDSVLYVMIQSTFDDISKLEKILLKFLEMTEEGGDIYDNIFLREFVKRIRRALYVVDNDLNSIEENLKEEEEG